MTAASPACPLCAGVDGRPIACDGRLYFRCPECALVYLHPEQRIALADEKAQYALHENDPADGRYRAFLSRSLDEVCERVQLPARGLDFGCGPGPALVTMAREAGYAMDAYDPIYAPDACVFDRRYDFITCTEVAEHLFAPGVELDRLWSLLEPGGVLVVQSARVLDDERFRSWHYRRDLTHVVFFADETFAWLASRWGAQLCLPRRDVAVLVRPGAKAHFQGGDR